MTRCTVCGDVFEKPAKNVYQDMRDGFSCSLYELVCPFCGAEEFYLEEVETCDYCGGFKREGMDMCDECHDNLMKEVAEFLSQYDSTQIAAIDYQLDGVSVRDFIERFTRE